MDSGKVNEWLQIIGTFGVVASLIFVGMQMKQTQEIALANTYNARASLTVEANSNVIGTPQHFSARAKIYSGRRNELTAEEYVAMLHELYSFLTMLENNHYQYEMGFLPEEHWRKNLADMDCRLSEPIFVENAEEWPARDSFRTILEASLEKGRQAGKSCWESTVDDPWQFFNPIE